MAALAAASRVVDRAVGEYLAHCRRMDIRERRRRRARLARRHLRRSTRTRRWSTVVARMVGR